MQQPRFHRAHGLPLVLEPDWDIGIALVGAGVTNSANTYAVRLGPVLLGYVTDDGEFRTAVILPEPTGPNDSDLITGADQDQRIQLALEALVAKLIIRSQLRAKQLELVAHPVATDTDERRAIVWAAYQERK